MKRWAILAGGAVVLIVAAVVIYKMTREEKAPPPPKVEGPTGPDPAHLAKVAEFARQMDEFEAKGEFKDALWALRHLEKLEPADPRIAANRPRLEEKLKRLETWQAAHQKFEIERKDAMRTNTLAAWQKVLELGAEAEKLGPLEKHQKMSRDLLVPSRQYREWAAARDEDRKGNLVAALDLATQAIAITEPPAELTAFKAALEKKKRKLDFDRAISAARTEAVPAKAYDLWQKARPLADDPKDQAEVDAKIDLLKVAVDPAERDRRYDAAMKAGDAALAALDFDAAEKAFKDAQALKVTELKPRQSLTKVTAARNQKMFELAVAEAKAAEEKKLWSDAMDAYDRALRIKPTDSGVLAKRKELEETKRPPKIVLVLNEQSGLKMEFVLIKRGTFQMGDGQGGSDEKPHPVTIAKDFWMQTTELTQAHWGILMNTKPWMSQSVPTLPVEGVSWDDAQKYLEKLSPFTREQVGRSAGLPTEAEWEYACRAGSTSRWSFGNDESQIDLYGWSSSSKVKGPQTVGQRPANAWGLFDMHGNVAEWCADGYASYDEKTLPDSPQFRIFRGGSWNDKPVNCRSGKREKDLPTKSNLFLGFRVVLR